MSACRILVAAGLPGSGKTSWFDRSKIETVSSDHVRFLLTGDTEDQSVNARVFQTVRHILAQRLRIGRPLTGIDATNVERWERAPYIRMARAAGARIEAVFFDVPFAVCLERNQRRSRNVPEDALRAMSARLEPPSLEEGFDAVTVVTA